ncbi:hypothetical protein IE81DRAFT_338850 [Ceraceosorus guamensis]|uniref:Uncharacterized protein n=1 Tax=Ceraceosorus guamensis TaxID=1522189 RepID=A0A316W949_9BASI|nr:hypothetical protein IE81DRAFT_338850 [Ceraceosorus guamensis]PWN46446.1 hypothetical protein IE81DRAFT_338850 [Ceraceosorus guamensis]
MGFEDVMAHVQSATYNVAQGSDLLSRLLTLEHGNQSSSASYPGSARSSLAGASASSTGTGVSKAVSFAACSQSRGAAGGVDKMVEAAIAVRDASRRQSIMSTSSSSQDSSNRIVADSSGASISSISNSNSSSSSSSSSYPITGTRLQGSLQVPGGLLLGGMEDQKTPTARPADARCAGSGAAGPVMDHGSMNELQSYPFTFPAFSHQNDGMDVDRRASLDADDALKHQASAESLLIDLEQRYLSAKGQFEALKETMGVIYASLTEAVASARRFARCASSGAGSLLLNGKQRERMHSRLKEHLTVQRSYFDEAAELVQCCCKARIGTKPIRADLAKLRGAYSELFEILEPYDETEERIEGLASEMEQACDELLARLLAADQGGGTTEEEKEKEEEEEQEEEEEEERGVDGNQLGLVSNFVT